MNDDQHLEDALGRMYERADRHDQTAERIMQEVEAVPTPASRTLWSRPHVRAATGAAAAVMIGLTLLVLSYPDTPNVAGVENHEVADELKEMEATYFDLEDGRDDVGSSSVAGEAAALAQAQVLSDESLVVQDVPDIENPTINLEFEEIHVNNGSVLSGNMAVKGSPVGQGIAGAGHGNASIPFADNSPITFPVPMDWRQLRYALTATEVEIAELERHQQANRRVQPKRTNPDEDATLTLLKIRRDQILEQMAKQDRILATHGLSRHTPENLQAPPRVEGRITTVNNEEQLVEISVGSDDGILRGHELDVFRLGESPRYLGKLKVFKAEAGKAVAKLIPGTQKGDFAPGDFVAPKFRLRAPKASDDRRPYVEGRVTAVNNEEKLVGLSVGTLDGLRRGDEIEVVRLHPVPRYLGKVKIINCKANESVAIAVRGTLKGDLEAGDYVTTRLGGRAKPRSWKRARAVPNASRLMIGDNDELPLKGMQVHVRVDGFRARVLLDFQFYNDRGRQLEGTFKLRLPSGASPYFLAFGETLYKSPEVPADRPVFFRIEEARDMGTSPEEIMEARSETWNKPKEARMVPKDKASNAYHRTVRRRIDPALMEWAGAGIFNARVFPIAPQKMHRIVVGYDVDLVQVGEDLVYQLDLPQLSDLVVDFSVATPGEMAARLLPHVDPVKAGDRTYFHLKNPQLESIGLRVSQPGTTLLRGTDPTTGDYFATRVVPELPAAEPLAGSPRAVFLLDVSLSSNPDKFNVWLGLLRAILEKNRGALDKFAVLCFNIESFWWKDGFVDNTPENVDALMEFADTLALEGATDLGQALREAAHPTWQADSGSVAPCDLFLLSDGAVTWGERDVHHLSETLKESSGSLYAYRTGLAGSDGNMLAHLARETGGAVFSVVGETEIGEAATAHRNRPWQLQRVELSGGQDLLVAGRPQSVYPGQQLLVVGRGRPTAESQLTLTVTRAGETKSIPCPLTQAVESRLTPRVYGQVATGQLEDFGHLTEELSQAYACHFRVTGRTSSLLMLESERDYQRFNIQPKDHAAVVKRSPAAWNVQQARAQQRRQIETRKAEFIAWLTQMEKTPGFRLRLTPALKQALRSLPNGAFEVAPRRLACRVRNYSDMPSQLRQQLASPELSYDAMNAEAKRRRREFTADDALKAVSSLVENNPGDVVLLRDVAFSAMEWGQAGHAFQLLRRAAELRPYQPQTCWAMAQCLEQMQKTDLALAFYEIAWVGQWDSRFGAWRQIVGTDYARFLRQADSQHGSKQLAAFADDRLRTVARHQPKADLVVTLLWNTDATDVDLHLYEPSGEHCYYGHNQTKSGGRLTRDVTQGFGPEMYTLADAPSGAYQLKVHYFASDRNRTQVRTKAYVTIYRNLGTDAETVERKVVELNAAKKLQDVGTVFIK